MISKNNWIFCIFIVGSNLFSFLLLSTHMKVTKNEGINFDSNLDAVLWFFTLLIVFSGLTVMVLNIPWVHKRVIEN